MRSSMFTSVLLIAALFVGCMETAPSSNTSTAGSTSTKTDELVLDADKPWRSDPALNGKFHPDYPDDIQVIVHEGGPRFTEKRAELVWVRVTRKDGVAYQGTLLNQPQQLPSLKQNDTISFVVANAENGAFMVTKKYLRERSEWHIGPCSKCGMSELFDAPSDLQAWVFPNIPAGAKMEAFTSFCPLCGGVQVVSPAPMRRLDCH